MASFFVALKLLHDSFYSQRKSTSALPDEIMTHEVDLIGVGLRDPEEVRNVLERDNTVFRKVSGNRFLPWNLLFTEINYLEHVRLTQDLPTL